MDEITDNDTEREARTELGMGESCGGFAEIHAEQVRKQRDELVVRMGRLERTIRKDWRRLKFRRIHPEWDLWHWVIQICFPSIAAVTL
jgi:hypothetical protein